VHHPDYYHSLFLAKSGMIWLSSDVTFRTERVIVFFFGKGENSGKKGSKTLLLYAEENSLISSIHIHKLSVLKERCTTSSRVPLLCMRL
jgi:hypothetical protein